MDELRHGKMVWYGWFSLIAGGIAIALIPYLWGSFGFLGNVGATLAGIASAAAIFRGWLVLSIANEMRAGARPAWGIFIALPWVIGFVALVCLSIVLAYLGYWAGQQVETSVLEATPPNVAWRFWASKAGYVIAGSMITWHLPQLYRAYLAWKHAVHALEMPC